MPICGGAILNPTTILSAAHCTLIDPDGLYRIVAGEHDLSYQEGHEQERLVEHILIHNGFDDFSYYNDIALFFLNKDTPLVFNDYVNKVDLPPKDYEPSGLATVAGWGADSDNLFKSSGGTTILNKLSIPYYDNDKCREIYDEDFVESMMLCAGNLDGGQDSCAGDSGGPLVSSKNIVAGLVSWGPGTGCGQKGFLGVYTRVSTYVDWINYVIQIMTRPADN